MSSKTKSRTLSTPLSSLNLAQRHAAAAITLAMLEMLHACHLVWVLLLLQALSCMTCILQQLILKQ